jgi:hypothetical protein
VVVVEIDVGVVVVEIDVGVVVVEIDVDGVSGVSGFGCVIGCDG